MQESRSSTTRPRLLGGLLCVLLLALLGLAVASILVFPTLLHPPLTDQELAGIRDPKDRLAAQDARRQRQDTARATLLQGVGALLVFTSAGLGAYFTWRQVRHNRGLLEAAREQLEVARQGQVTERFTRAIDQLGSDQLDIRLGGIYALERIARDSEADQTTIAEVLTSYIRTHSPWPPTRPGQGRADLTPDQLGGLPDLRSRMPDVQAALTVLGRGDFASLEVQRGATLDLQAADLRNANLDGAHLEGARLGGANLDRAQLSGAHLEGAILDGAHLDRARLFGAHLEGVRLRFAHLERAILDGAHLENADLIDARLTQASLTFANLKRADLLRTRLEGANLAVANLEGARLADAHLDGTNVATANLEGVILDGAQLDGARLVDAHLEGALATDATSWPDGFDWQAAGVILVDVDGIPVPAAPGPAGGAAPTIPAIHGQLATDGDFGADGEARSDA